MFIVLLTFSDNKTSAPRLMDDHKNWIKEGLSSGIFLLVGSLKPTETIEGGGGILAIASDKSVIQDYVNQDPFVVEDVVKAEIIEISPNQVDDRLRFLMD